MKIAIISRNWFTETKGGAERYIYELAKGLMDRGHEIITVSRQDSDLPNEHMKVWTPAVAMVGSALFSLLGARKLKGKDVSAVIVNQFWAEMATHYLDGPSVLVIHDVGLYESAIAQRRRVRHFFRKRILKRAVRRASMIIVPSKLTSDQLMKHLDVPREKIVLVPEGVDLQLFRPREGKTDTKRILCTGRFSPNKGHMHLIEAFETFRWEIGRPHELILVGHVPNREKDYFKRLEKHAGDGVKIVTEVSDAELASHYRDADVCVFPSVADEGWGLTVVEAFACGVPVICSDIFIETGVATEDRAIVFPRGDVQALVEALDVLTGSPELGAELSRRGLVFARSLSWEGMTEKIEEVVFEVVEATGNGDLDLEPIMFESVI